VICQALFLIFSDLIQPIAEDFDLIQHLAEADEAVIFPKDFKAVHDVLALHALEHFSGEPAVLTVADGFVTAVDLEEAVALDLVLHGGDLLSLTVVIIHYRDPVVNPFSAIF
jgi:hypothetical protein